MSDNVTEKKKKKRLYRNAYRTTCYGNRVVEHEENLIAIQALEKQMPKKPKEIDCIGFDTLACPECKMALYLYEPYCDNCGQAIDWSDEDEID